jgi:cobalt-zinc-cadmium efflux system outer membrane protein
MAAKSWLTALGLLILSGCAFPVRQQVDQLLCERGNLGHDVRSDKDAEADRDERKKAQPDKQDPKKPLDIRDRLTVPDTVPGSEARQIVVPKKEKNEEANDEVIRVHFPPLAKLKPDADFPDGPDGQPLTLAELQKIAFSKSPLLRQAATDIEAARGAAIQAGAYPNPSFGYQTSGAGPSGGPTYGAFFSQTIKTAGKLKLAQAAALMDLQNAEIAYRRAETDLMANVRTNYYAVLVAQESVRANFGLVELTDEVYRVMVDQLRGGIVAPYEPLQLKVFSEQARIALVQARNAKLLAWRQLASVLGEPHMPATALAGQVHRAVPRLDFEKALGHVLTKHTDVLTTEATIEKARYNLRLAQATPYPDVNVQAGLQTDATAPGPSRLLSSVQVSVPVPVFDRNRGGIQQARAALMRANEEPHRVQADLTGRFSEAWRRYEENRDLLERYRKEILPKQVQAFRTAVSRHWGAGAADAGAPAYNDLISSEQNLITVIGNYLPVLQAQWQAVVDVSSLLQTNQLYQMTDEVNDAPPIDFEALLKLPCKHPCPAPTPEPTRESFRAAPAVPLANQPLASPAKKAAFLAPSAVQVAAPAPSPNIQVDELPALDGAPGNASVAGKKLLRAPN